MYGTNTNAPLLLPEKKDSFVIKFEEGRSHVSIQTTQFQS